MSERSADSKSLSRNSKTNSPSQKLLTSQNVPGETMNDLDSYFHFDNAIRDIAVVHSQLKRHSERLKTWDEALRKRELITDQILRDSDARINAEVERQFKRGKEQYEKEIKLLESQIKEKSLEIQRLQTSFNNIRESYNKVKLERNRLDGTCTDLRKKNQALESRVKNLKKITPKGEKDLTDVPDKMGSTNDVTSMSGECAKNTTDSEKPKQLSSKSGLKRPTIKCADVIKGPLFATLKELLIWFCEIQLRPLISIPAYIGKSLDDEESNIKTQTLDRCLVLLPKITDLLHLHMDKRSGLLLDENLFSLCLKFLHFSFLLMEWSEGAQKQKVASSIHRLGEAIHKGFILPNSENPTSTGHIEEELCFCASVVVLHTVKQVDILVHSWKTIKSMVSTTSGRQCFVKLKGHVFILYLLTSQDYQFLTNQLSRAVDVLLCMYVEQDSNEANEVREILTSSEFIKSFCSLISNAPESIVPVQAKERIVVLFQQAIKRHISVQTRRMISEHKLLQVLQKELTKCLSFGEARTSYEFVLKATIDLLSLHTSKQK